MRKHPRPTALPAVLSLAAALSAAGALATAAPAVAHGSHDGPRARRAPAPPTPQNFELLRECESEGDYAARSARGRYYGAYQFSIRTWRSLGYEGRPHQAPSEVQDEAAQRLQARSGWQPWPACSRKLGLR